MTEINPIIFVVDRKDHENCRIQLLVVVVFCKLKQNWKKWWWWCSTKTVFICTYSSWWHVLCEI